MGETELSSTEPVQPTPPGVFQILVAFLVPMALVSTWVNLVFSYKDLDADQVVMGDGEVGAIEVEPEVVVLGNSLAFRGVEPIQLKRALGIEGEVYALTFPGSWAPTWYAALKNQIYAHDLRPKYIVVVNTLEYMLRTERPDGRRENDLKAVMTDDEPVIQDKVYGARLMTGPLAELDDKRGRVGQSWIDGLLSLPYLSQHNPNKHARRTLARVFDVEGATDARLNTRVIPIVEVDQRRRTNNADPSASLIPDLIDLAHEFGSKIVFARVPVSRAGRIRHPLPSRETERQTIALLNEREVGYVDLHGLSLPATAFVDDEHLSRSGQATYTKLLAERLLDIGLLTDEPFPKARLPPRPPDVRREGTPTVTMKRKVDFANVHVRGCRINIPTPGLAPISDANLEELGLGSVSPIRLVESGQPMKPHTRRDDGEACEGTSYHFRKAVFGWSKDGDPWDKTYRLSLAEDLPLLPTGTDDPAAWWVYPGTTLVLEFAEDAELPDGPAVVDVAAVMLGRDGKRPVIRADGERATTRHRGLRLLAEMELEAAPMRIEIEVPEDGAFVLVRHVGLMVDDWMGHLIGTADESDTTVRLLTGKHDPAITAAVASPEVPNLGLFIPNERGAAPRIEIPELTVISTRALTARTGARHDLPENHPYRHTMMTPLRHCSPLRLFEDGVELQRLREARNVDKRQAATYGHRGSAIEFWPIDGTLDHEYTTRLAEDRLCMKHLWIYPGDKVEIRNPDMFKQLYSGADTLRLGGFVFGNRSIPDLRVRVESAAGLHLDKVIRAGRIEGEQLPIRLPWRIPPRPQDVVVTIETVDAGPFVLMQVVSFEDQERLSMRRGPLQERAPEPQSTLPDED